MTDRTAKEYAGEIERLNAVWEDLKVQLRAAKTETERRSIRAQQVTVKIGRGQLRKTLAYMLSRDRMRTDGRRLQIEGGDESYIGLDGEKVWID